MGEGLGFYKEYIAGMNAGLATVAVGHPFDTVKVISLYKIPNFDFFLSFFTSVFRPITCSCGFVLLRMHF